MFGRTLSGAVQGIDGFIVEIEVQIGYGCEISVFLGKVLYFDHLAFLLKEISFFFIAASALTQLSYTSRVLFCCTKNEAFVKSQHVIVAPNASIINIQIYEPGGVIYLFLRLP